MSANLNNCSTELFNAIEKNDVQTVKRLVEGGISLNSTVDANQQTVAHVATHRNNLQILSYLLKKSVSLLYIRDRWNQTVLHLAAKEGHLGIFKYIVDDNGEFHIDVNLPENRLNGNTAIHIAAEEGHLPIVNYYLKEYGPKGNPDLKNEKGETLMMSAAKKARLPVVEYLVEDGFNSPGKLDYKENHVLFHSAVIGDLTVPNYLLNEVKIELDVNWTNIFNETIVFTATTFNHLAFIKYFIEEKNATIDTPNNMGYTPLHEAANKGYFRIVKYLVKKKANMKLKDLQGKTPAQVAKKKKIIEYLRSVEIVQKVEQETKKQRRSRRSIFVRHSPLSQSWMPRKWIQKIKAGPFGSSVSRIDGSHRFRTVDGISSFLYFEDFLLFAEICVNYVGGVAYQRARHRSLLSPHEMIRERMDPVALDAIDVAAYDFAYARTNNDYNDFF